MLGVNDFSDFRLGMVLGRSGRIERLLTGNSDFHYGLDRFDDNGWGCAYRSFQTLISYLILNGFLKSKELPRCEQDFTRLKASEKLIPLFY